METFSKEVCIVNPKNKIKTINNWKVIDLTIVLKH